MHTRRRLPRTEKVVRQWHLLPPLTHGGEPLEGGATLEEIPGPLGVLLWQTLRDVLLWAETPPDDRDELFAAGAGEERRAAIARTDLPDDLVGPLTTLASIVDAPTTIDATRVTAACAAIAGWARREGAPATALAFAQDAALAVPDDAATALEVARYARRAGDHARAELWYRRATGLARRGRNWRLYTAGFSGLGVLYRDRGNLPAAHRFHLRALRGARRGGLRRQRAVALHDLFAVAVDAGRTREAERYAREAAAAYPGDSERLPVLAHDIAYHWMESGSFERALAVFESVVPLMRTPAERLWAEANRMRAAAGAGQTDLAVEAADRVREACGDPSMAAAAARAQLELARGELQLGRLEHARIAVREAARLGRLHRDGRTVMSAESVLEAVDAAASSRRTAAPRRAAAAANDREGDELARTLLETLGVGRNAANAGNSARNGETRMHSPWQPDSGPR